LSAPTRQQSCKGCNARKGTAQQEEAVWIKRPDSKARPVTVERLRAVLRSPEMTDENAAQWLEHLFALGNVIEQAFREQQGGASVLLVEAEPIAVIPHSLKSNVFAA
jgi:hypothetical protein